MCVSSHFTRVNFTHFTFCTEVFQNGTGMYPGSDFISINSTNNAHDNYKGKVGLVSMCWYEITVAI